jgi:hypothetical protein
MGDQWQKLEYNQAMGKLCLKLRPNHMRESFSVVRPKSTELHSEVFPFSGMQIQRLDNIIHTDCATNMTFWIMQVACLTF